MKTTLDKLIEALCWMQDDERDFDLDYPVHVYPTHTKIEHMGFLYSKLTWFLENQSSTQTPIKEVEE